MKKQKVCKILRKYGLMSRRMTNRKIGHLKGIFLPHGTWRQFLNYIMMLKYLDEKGPLPEEGIYIEELNMQLGGTLTVMIENGKVTDVEHSAVEANNAG